jgi:hypothetical protein
MGMLQIAAAGVVGYVLYRFIKREQAERDPVAFAPGEATGGIEVRNAGPDAMRMDPPEWDEVDDMSDASFPASDPPAANRFT